jgi:hypothetical protein
VLGIPVLRRFHLASEAIPLGFFDTRHHLPVVRHAIIASSFGIRFQGEG